MSRNKDRVPPEFSLYSVGTRLFIKSNIVGSKDNDMFQVAAIQLTPILNDVEANLKRGISFMRQVADEADLIVFPELWTTGYYLSKQAFMELAETTDGPTINLLKK
ncbi:MAG: hypothetical protein OMM_11593 [Candidatus Magnetoglobus multicellularis str. Araruama]|uniref:CN hydrolase domain-containing protein n=1 Tax=Candidatus Magnetoglobus multicellularis str. Araruama TaxID=890399 RepID=A0A1V1NY35_9BACT|nr:MAG: hypothetical protein OMM_11593 [Candidatus Magnetoglobus multicellularis str. Araruama]